MNLSASSKAGRTPYARGLFHSRECSSEICGRRVLSGRVRRFLMDPSTGTVDEVACRVLTDLGLTNRDRRIANIRASELRATINISIM